MLHSERLRCLSYASLTPDGRRSQEYHMICGTVVGRVWRCTGHQSMAACDFVAGGAMLEVLANVVVAEYIVVVRER